MPGWRYSLPRYVTTAVLSCLSDWVTFVLLVQFQAFYVYAQMIARIVGGLVSFFVNKYWSFRSPEARAMVIQGVRFAVLYAVSYFLSTGLLYTFVEFVGLPVYVGKVMADGICFVLNFIVMKRWVYARPEDRQEEVGDHREGAQPLLKGQGGEPRNP